MNITIIGAGNMGGAAAIGLSKTGKCNITVTARHQKTLDKFKGYNITTSLDNGTAIAGADMVFLVVKPWLMENVIKSILPQLDLNRQLIVSMAPGIKSEQLKSWIGENASIAYVIPNTAIEVGESMTFIVPVTVSKEQTDSLKELFDCVGSSLVVEERLLVAGTSLASCGIAYALRYIRAAAEGGVELGFFANDAINIVAQTVRGASAILKAHGSHPEEEIDKVTTPGGMTIKGLNAMENEGFTAAVIKGLKAN